MLTQSPVSIVVFDVQCVYNETVNVCQLFDLKTISISGRLSGRKRQRPTSLAVGLPAP